MHKLRLSGLALAKGCTTLHENFRSHSTRMEQGHRTRAEHNINFCPHVAVCVSDELIISCRTRLFRDSGRVGMPQSELLCQRLTNKSPWFAHAFQQQTSFIGV